MNLDTQEDIEQINPQLLKQTTIVNIGNICKTSNITSINFLVNCVKLESFGIYMTQIKDLKPISNTTTLKKITIDNCNSLKRLDHLQFCINIERIQLKNLIITDINVFKCFNKLKNVSISLCLKIQDFSVLANNVILTVLQLDTLNIDNVSFLKNMKQIQKIHLTNCQYLTNIEPIETCSDLYHLKIQNTGIYDISSLVRLKKLKTIDLADNEQLESLYQQSIYDDRQKVEMFQQRWSTKQFYIDYAKRKNILLIFTEQQEPLQQSTQINTAVTSSQVNISPVLKKQVIDTPILVPQSPDDNKQQLQQQLQYTQLQNDMHQLQEQNKQLQLQVQQILLQKQQPQQSMDELLQQSPLFQQIVQKQQIQSKLEQNAFQEKLNDMQLQHIKQNGDVLVLKEQVVNLQKVVDQLANCKQPQNVVNMQNNVQNNLVFVEKIQIQNDSKFDELFKFKVKFEQLFENWSAQKLQSSQYQQFEEQVKLQFYKISKFLLKQLNNDGRLKDESNGNVKYTGKLFDVNLKARCKKNEQIDIDQNK